MNSTPLPHPDRYAEMPQLVCTLSEAAAEQPIHVHKLMAALERAGIPSQYSHTDNPLPHRLSSNHADAFSVAQSLNLVRCSLEAL